MIVFLLLAVMFLAGCKDAVQTIDKAANEVTGYNAVKESEGVNEKVAEAEKKEQERARQINEADKQASE